MGVPTAIYPNFWKAAGRFYHADTLSSHWRKRKNLPHKAAAVDPASINRLEEASFGALLSSGTTCVSQTSANGSKRERQ